MRVIGAFDLQPVRAVEGLQVSSQVFSAQGVPTREQFARYGASRLCSSTTLALLEWQPVTPHAQLAEFERHAARELPGFRVVEPAPEHERDGFVAVHERAVHVPVLCSWPESGAALGVDMAFYPRRMRSKLLARDAGSPVASETFGLIRRGQVGPAASGFAVSAPVYRTGRPVGGRRGAPSCWATSPGSVLDGTAAGTWDWHIDSGRLVVNERWAQMLGRLTVPSWSASPTRRGSGCAMPAISLRPTMRCNAISRARTSASRPSSAGVMRPATGCGYKARAAFSSATRRAGRCASPSLQRRLPGGTGRRAARPGRHALLRGRRGRVHGAGHAALSAPRSSC